MNISKYAIIYLATAFSLLAIIVLGGGFFVFKVNSSSMEPSLCHGDVLLIRAGGRDAARGDVLVFRPSSVGVTMVKRVLGTEGDIIVIRSSTALLGSERGQLKYMRAGETALEIPPGHFFAYGDNHSESHDSRSFGFVSNSVVIGRLIVNLSNLFNSDSCQKRRLVYG